MESSVFTALYSMAAGAPPSPMNSNGATTPSDVFSEKMIEVCSILDKIDDKTKELERNRYEALNLINHIENPKYRSVLTLYYVQPVDRYRLPRWSDVARALESEEGTVRLINWRALKLFDKIFTKYGITS